MTTTYRTLREEAVAYYALCDEARRLNIPTSLDDPDAPDTVEGLQAWIDGVKRGRDARLRYDA